MKRVNVSNIRKIALLLLVLGLSVALSAQSYRGGLRGEVKDPGGNALAKVTVTARNVETTRLAR